MRAARECSDATQEALSESDWARLYSRVVPNPIALDTFKASLCDGTLQEVYLAKDLHKIVQEMRDILREHGELREAASFPTSGRKSDLARAAAAAVRVLAHHSHPTTVNSSGARPGYAPAMASGTVSLSRPVPGHGAGARLSLEPVPTRGGFPFAAVAPTTTSASPTRSGSGNSATAPAPTVRAGSRTPPLTDAVDADDVVTAPLTAHETATSSSAPRVGAELGVGAANELAVLNERASPFARILNVVRRLQLRYGSHALRFDVPVQYAHAVSTRRLRVQLIPVHHPNQPARWPTAREVVVYVNEQCLSTPWRRAWPERQPEVEKSYLGLDLTQLLVRGGVSQRVRVDIFNRDYCAAAVLAIVQPHTLEEVEETVLTTALGEGRWSCLVDALTTTRRDVALDRRLDANDAMVRAFYQGVLEEGRAEDEVEGMEVDDPVIATTCPISRTMMRIPVRGVHCRHLQCVDLQSYLVSANKACYWNCVLCDQPLRVTALQIDTVLWRFLARVDPATSSPFHLRLATRPATEEGESTVYEWYVSPATGVARGCDVDDDDDNDNDDDTARADTRDGCVKTEGMTEAQRDGQTGYDDTCAHKRSREEADASYRNNDGTEDCPIEL